MANIAAANAVYVTGNAPTVTGEVKVGRNELDFVLVGQATLVGESGGADVDGDVNFIDGTKVIAPTPTKVFAMRIGGTAAAACAVVSCTAITSAKFLVTLSVAPASGLTVIIAFFAAR